ncbi:MAG: PopZ family protein [Pseudolabrys sp.]
MSQAAKAQEPSMEEILASIRRIIADDDANKTAKPPEPPAPPKPAPPVAAPPKPTPPPSKPAPPPAPPAMLDQDAVDKVMAQPAPPAKADGDDILDLTESMATQNEAAAPSFRTIDGGSDIVFSDQPPEPPPPPPPEPAPMRTVTEAKRQFVQTTAPDYAIMSNATATAVDSAFNSLANTVLGNNARTLEDLVKEMLRPMLKSWLDDNLPGLVERIVRAEIERVSRGRS